MRLPILALICIAYVHTQTPVIGGSCSLGTSDVQIGGKSTQFFLKCENTSDSPSGEGVWVVKSRAASPPAPEPVQHTRPKVMHKQPNICEQDINAREGESCAVSETCLQTHHDAPSSYLQCEQTKMMWHRRDCHDNTIFNFEQQSCIVPKRVHSLSRCPQCYDQNGCTGCPYGYNYNSINTNQQRPFSFSAYNTDHTNSLQYRNRRSISDLSSNCSKCVICSSNGDCPRDFACSKGCCKLSICPGKGKLGSTCQSDLNCEPNQRCVFGTCCDRKQSKPKKTRKFKDQPDSFSSMGVGSVVSEKKIIDREKIADEYKRKMDEMYSLVEEELKGEKDMTSTTTEIPSTIPTTTVVYIPITPQSTQESINLYFGLQPKSVVINSTTPSPIFRDDSCIPLEGSSPCSLLSPCPPSSSCIDGRCCLLLPPPPSCPSALSLPSSCLSSDECPIASRCLEGVCCPLSDGSSSHLIDIEESIDPPPSPSSESFSSRLCPSDTESLSGPAHCSESTDCPSHFECTQSKCCPLPCAVAAAAPIHDISSSSSSCLADISCDSISLCPPSFTCSLVGQCCHQSETCPDGSTPSSLCSDDRLCPSSSHQCIPLGTEGVRGCCEIEESSFCPSGSMEVSPRIGSFCRYSIHCPSPFFCNRAGRCCVPEISSLHNSTNLA